MKKINIAELLKDCPSGMELDCTMYDNVYFDEIDENNAYPIRCYVLHDGGKESIRFTSFGTYAINKIAKCVIFPKGKTTWEGFQRHFKDGDILACNQVGNKNSIIYIYCKNDKTQFSTYYVALIKDELKISNTYFPTLSSVNENLIRFATEEEKEKLFNKIQEHGYRWNTETKTLETLIKPKFKVENKVRHKKNRKQHIITKIHKDCYECDNRYILLFEGQDDYELVSNKAEPMETDMNDNKISLNMSAIDYNNGLVGYEIPTGYEFDTVINNKVVLKKLKPQYPKTYKECCDVLDIYPNEDEDVIDYLIKPFTKLLLCRNTYWLMVGKQMGLDKPWEPNWENCNEDKYCLYITKNNVTKGTFCWDNHILAFPTEEMQDVFYENFKDLIEACKELI